MLQKAIKTDITEEIHHEYLSVHGYVVESMWWFLHRTTTFHIDFTAEEMHAVSNMLQQHNLITLDSGNSGGIPDIAVSLFTIDISKLVIKHRVAVCCVGRHGVCCFFGALSTMDDSGLLLAAPSMNRPWI